MSLLIEQECVKCKDKKILKFFFIQRGKENLLCNECAEIFKVEFDKFILEFLDNIIDYQEILKKYMYLVALNEGVTFIDLTPNEASDIHNMSKEEVNALIKTEKEAFLESDL